MEQHTKLGTMTIALSVILALASLVFSTSGCAADNSLVTSLMYCLRVVIYEDIPGNEYAEHMYIPTKYLLLTCSAIFAVGVLWYRGALPVPARLKSLLSPNE